MLELGLSLCEPLVHGWLVMHIHVPSHEVVVVVHVVSKYIERTNKSVKARLGDAYPWYKCLSLRPSLDYPPSPAMSKSRVAFIICVGKIVVIFVVLCCNPIADASHCEINNPLQLSVEEEVVERPPMFCIQSEDVLWDGGQSC